MPHVLVRATERLGQYKPGDEIPIGDKYAARSLVAMGKAVFVNEADEFRKPAPSPRARRRRYQRRDMVPEGPREVPE